MLATALDNVAYSAGTNFGWQYTTGAALGYLARNFGLAADAVPFLALVLVGRHRSSQVGGGVGTPPLHLRHFRVGGWTELLFWFVVVSGVATIADLAVVASSEAASAAEVWWVLGGVLEGLAILLVGWAGVIVSRRLTRDWISAHVLARGGLAPTGQPAAT